jgi:uncharacterized membrane protein (UPF0127 family)
MPARLFLQTSQAVRVCVLRGLALLTPSRLVFIVALFVWTACGSSPRADSLEPLTVVTDSGAHDFVVEIAKDEMSRERGLMFRRFMAGDHGMLFEFESEDPQSFWMKNTYIPLDIIFIDRSGRVIRVAANAEPLSERTIPSGGPCIAVLELNGGVAADIGLKIGDQVKHPFFKP